MRSRKLTDEQLERIRTVIAARKALPTHAELARLHGVSKSLVDQIAAGVCYKVGRKNRPQSRGEFTPCSRCGGVRDRPSAPYCRECRAAYARENRPKHSELSPEQRAKANARSTANVAQTRGQLVKQPCEKCGEADTQKHHDDYSKPLEVRWLCALCHQQEHKSVIESHADSVESGSATPQTQL